MRHLVIIFLIPFLSCEYSNKGEVEGATLDSVEVQKKQNNFTSRTQPKPQNDLSLTLVYENDTLIQKIKVHSISKTEISFTLISENKLRGKSSQIEGTAKSRAEADFEIDEDEEGNAYPVQQYFFEKNCWLSIRVDVEQNDKIRVVEANCERQHDKSCPFGSIGILRKSN